MANHQAAELISKGLVSGLPHPGNPDDGTKPHSILLPVFNPVGHPAEVVEQINAMALSLAEAIVFLMEENNISLVPSEELQSLRANHDPDKGKRTVAVYCRCDTTKPLLILDVTESPQVIVDGRALLSGFRTLQPACPHQPEGGL